MILSLGRLMRCGWELAQESNQPMIKKDGCRLPIRLRRNTLTLIGMVSLIASGCAGPPGPDRVQVNTLTFDDVGALAPEAEDVASIPGWHILGSGLPFLVVHRTEDLRMEQNLWSPADWPWAAVFVRIDPATRLPKPRDAWTQVVAMKTEDLSQAPGKLTELNDELTGPRDVCILLHVEELPKDLLSRPRDYFQAPEDDCIAVPAGEIEGGAGAMPDEVVAEERNMDVEEADGEQLDGVTLAFETPLRDLRALCVRQGLSSSGSKAKVLRRLKQHYEVLERQMAGQLAHKLYMEEDRSPDLPRAPRLPSARQQELHSVTHQPFANWCEACVLGRGKASPHAANEKREPGEDLGKESSVPLFQIDYSFTFTRRREEEEAGDAEGSEEEVDPADYQDQFGLTLVGAEATTGWAIAVPVLQKGAGALRRVVEQLVRCTLQVAPTGAIILQGDPEASIKQIVNAVAACRSKLGLETQTRFVPRGSHQSNGLVEKMVQTVRNNGKTLRAYLEDRCRCKIEGHRHVFAWTLRHAAFLLNRFGRPVRGIPPFEVIFARRFKGVILPFGEQCLFHSSGAAVIAAKGLPWDYQGTKRRKRPLYTSARVPLLPDSATLEEVARKAASEVIASSTPKPPGPDEAGSDSPTTSSSSTSSSQSPGSSRDRQEQQEQQQATAERAAPMAAEAGTVPNPTWMFLLVVALWQGQPSQSRDRKESAQDFFWIGPLRLLHLQLWHLAEGLQSSTLLDTLVSER